MENSDENCQAEIISNSPAVAENEKVDIKEGGFSTGDSVTPHNFRGEIMLGSLELFPEISDTLRNCIRW